MTHAYDKIYLNMAQKSMGDMCHFASHDMGWNLHSFFLQFISTGVANAFEKGNPAFIAGRSGYELAYEVYYRLTGSECEVKPNYVYGKSPEYFAGWSLAYYSWYRDMSFAVIDRVISIDEIVDMYHPYHEMDIISFVDVVDDRLREHKNESMLKRLRTYAGLTQKQLAARAGVSQRMIEQYEQGRKDISHASAQSVLNIADAVGCSVEELCQPVSAKKLM